MSTFFFNFSPEGISYDREDAGVYHITQVHSPENLLLKGCLALFKHRQALIISYAVEYRGYDGGGLILDQGIERITFQILKEIEGCGILGKRGIQKGYTPDFVLLHINP